MTRPTLTGIILAQDNAATVGPVLDQLCSLADEVLLVDGGSTDATVEIAEGKPGVRVLRRPFDYHARQRNFALDNARGTWTLMLDSDELFGPRAMRWIPWLIRVPGVNWYSFPRYWLVEEAGSLKFLARKPYYRDRQLRLMRRRPALRYFDAETPHERLPREHLGFGRGLRRMHIFHYDFVLSDRESREAKVARYRSLDTSDDHIHCRYLWEESGCPLSEPKEPLPGDLRSPARLVAR
jgi:glycosyltransferase involved in cell wall biosynthesis